MDSLQDSFAELLHAIMIGSEAHWYRVIDIDDVPSNVKNTFPSLSRLFSLEQHVIHDIIQALNLVGKRNVKGITRVNANHDSWDAFLSTYRLDAEVTSFEILKRRYVFICLGYWDEIHSKKTPGNIWKDSCNQKGFRVPKVTLGTPLIHFAKAVGEFIATEPSYSPRLAADSGIPPSDEYSTCIDSDSDSESSLYTAQVQEMKNNG